MFRQKRVHVNQMTEGPLLTTILFVGMSLANEHLSHLAAIGVNPLLLMVFAAYVVWKDFPLSKLPVVGKYFRGKK